MVENDAIILHAFGESFAAATVRQRTPVPRPGPGEVLVRNSFAGVNALFDINMARNRIGYASLKPPLAMGIEAVGHVEAVGPAVTGFKAGDAVATARLGGGYRLWQIARADDIYAVPAATPQILALIPTGISALVCLEQIAQPHAGETLVMTAAAGGLGHIALQLAKSLGCRVIGLAGSEAKCAAIRALGADAAINYKTCTLDDALRVAAPDGIDIAYDTVGGALFDTLLDHLAHKGRLIVSGFSSEFETGPQPVLAPRVYDRLYWKSASIRAFQNAHFRDHHRDAARRLIDWHTSGALRVLVDPVPFAGLDAVTAAQDHLLGGHNLGKVVVDLRG